MKIFAVLALAFVAIQARPQGKALLTTEAGYIVGGEDAQPGSWPWQVSLQRCSIGCSHSCGAVVINANWVLTAAHCIQSPSVSAYRLVFGLHRRDDESGAQARTPSIVRPHPNWINDGSLGFPNDVGVVKLSSPVNLAAGNVAAAALVSANSGALAGQACTITGWGRLFGGGPLPNVLQQAGTRVLSTAQCRSQGIPQADDFYHICLNDDSSATGSCNVISVVFYFRRFLQSFLFFRVTLAAH